MPQKMGKDERGISPVIGVILMVLITAILAAVIAFLVYGGAYYYIKIEKLPDKDFLLIKALTYTNNSPLPNVTIKVSEHGSGRLLSGPYMTNESGHVVIQIPKGYDEYFDIVGEYNNVTMTFTIDKRPLLVRSEDKLGNLGIGLVILFVTLAAGTVGWFLKSWINKKG